MRENGTNELTIDYKSAQQELEDAFTQFNHADPLNVHAVDAAIYRISAAEKSIASAYYALKQVEAETKYTA